MSTAIEFNHVGKQYRLGLVSTGTLSHDLNRWWQTAILRREDPYLKIGDVNDRSAKADSEYVWALRDIDFKVEQGDVVGIIGKNGAGKSTLLKLLSKVTAPTVGTIRARGRIASLLEVGTGFHAEMTGRENIYMNGAILGMSKAEIDRKIDEIIDFSGCEKYIDTPVKRYSSGMTVRLGFAVAAFLDPEILVVDEVLAVGDAEFPKKAIGKMKDVSQGEGRTVLFVSHNMNSIRQLCKTGLVLDKGSVQYHGTVDNAIDLYLGEKMGTHRYVNPHPDDNDPLKYVVIQSIECKDNIATFSTIDPISFDLVLRANRSVKGCRINLTIDTMDDLPVGTVISNSTFDIEQGEVKTVRITLTSHNLSLGEYKVSFSVGTGRYNEIINDFQIVGDAVYFQVDKYSPIRGEGYAQWLRQWGSIYLPHKLEIVQ